MEGENSFLTSSGGKDDGIQKTRPAHGRTSGPARRSARGQWTVEEDEILCSAVQRFKGKNWRKIAECFKDRTDVQCLHRWQKVLNPELVKGPWSKEEDEIIIQLVHRYGPKKWSMIAQHLPGRIGKQCRERWHNHLNPAINKEAWTQEEELVLIRAHQIYGNRWAELTKFLPGRTDNGIKNHWHSSVKKKLESYLASGLLEQYQAIPLTPYQHTSMLSSSMTLRKLVDESCCKAGVEAEEELESSNSSSMICCSQSSSDMPNAITNTAEHLLPTEMSYQLEHNAFATYNADLYYCSAFEDITFSDPQTPHEMEDSQLPDQKFSEAIGTSSSKDYQCGSQELPDIASLELKHDSSGFQADCTNTTESHQVTDLQFQTSKGLDYSKSVANMEITHSGALTSGPNMVHLKDYLESRTFLSPDIQMPDKVGSLTSQTCPPKSSALGTSSSELFRPAPLHISTHERVRGSTQLICHPFEAQPKCNSISKDGFICVNNSAINTPCDSSGDHNSNSQDQSFIVNDSKKLVPVNDFGSQPEVKPPTIDEVNADKKQTEQAGALCNELTRFPKLDVPFVNSDLTQLKSDLQHDFSPLGIRKLLMSSMSCMSPLRLWDSPSRDCSPKAVLRSGTKPFSGTASILRKRNRDLRSPFSEKRCEKKLERDITSNLARDFSNLDVMFDECESQKSAQQMPSSSVFSGCSVEKDNQANALNGLRSGNETDIVSVSYDKAPENQSTGKDDSCAAAKNLSRFLMEQNIKDPLCSPENCGSGADIARISGSEIRHKTTEDAAYKSDSESLSIFCGTPVIKSLDSPSAWNSPWFINTLLSSPRFDLTIEDIEYLLSPEDTSSDTIAKQKLLDGDKENAHVLSSHQLEKCSKQASNIVAEPRILDFSDCVSPGKRTESGRASRLSESGLSPSSYLLKGCR